MANIEVGMCEGCGAFHTTVNGNHVMTSGSRGVCTRLAKVLSTAHNMPRREAVRYLCDEVGYEPEGSTALLDMMTGRSAGTSLH